MMHIIIIYHVCSYNNIMCSYLCAVLSLPCRDNSILGMYNHTEHECSWIYSSLQYCPIISLSLSFSLTLSLSLSLSPSLSLSHSLSLSPSLLSVLSCVLPNQQSLSHHNSTTLQYRHHAIHIYTACMRVSNEHMSTHSIDKQASKHYDTNSC